MSLPYKITLTEGGYYSFITKHAIEYRCYFQVSNGARNLFGLNLKSELFSFNFGPKEPLKNIPVDNRIQMTISKMLNDFFLKNPEAILNYICDNSDERAYKRHNHFMKWFEKNNVQSNKVLIKGTIPDVFYLGVIMMSEHP